jgi:hypothetical protein
MEGETTRIWRLQTGNAQACEMDLMAAELISPSPSNRESAPTSVNFHQLQVWAGMQRALG